MSALTLRTALSAALVERDDEAQALMLGLVARQHVLFVGPPGIGKSYMIRAAASGIAGARYCERLLAPATPPEAVFGPVSLAALRQDRYEHVLAGGVADCHIAFLDELPRTSDALLDSLLHILGPERQALLGTQQVKVPLIMAVAAANTWPDEPGRAAALDRFLIRRNVRRLSPAGRSRMVRAALPAVGPCLTLAELAMAQAQADAMPVSDAAWDALDQALLALDTAGISPSDRRCRLSVDVLRAAAVIDGAAEVGLGHLASLTDVLWAAPEQAAKAAQVILKIADPAGAEALDLLAQADEIGVPTERLAAIEAAPKLDDLLVRAETLAARSGGNGRPAKVAAHLRDRAFQVSVIASGMTAEKFARLAAGLAGGRKP